MTDSHEPDVGARYRRRIEAELAELAAASTRSSEDRKPVELDQQSVGRLSRMDALQGQAMANALETRRRRRVRALEAALARIEAGEFGWCADCGEAIGTARLDLDPVVPRCRDCATASE